MRKLAAAFIGLVAMQQSFLVPPASAQSTWIEVYRETYDSPKLKESGEDKTAFYVDIKSLARRGKYAFFDLKTWHPYKEDQDPSDKEIVNMWRERGWEVNCENHKIQTDFGWNGVYRPGFEMQQAVVKFVCQDEFK